MQLCKQPAILIQPLRRRPVEVVDGPDVHPLEAGIGQSGEMGGVADEPFVGSAPSRATMMTEACTGPLTPRADRNAVTGSGTESSSQSCVSSWRAARLVVGAAVSQLAARRLKVIAITAAGT